MTGVQTCALPICSTGSGCNKVQSLRPRIGLGSEKGSPGLYLAPDVPARRHSTASPNFVVRAGHIMQWGYLDGP